MTPIFLDTSYLLALELANDQYHQTAIQHWHSLSRSRPLLVTTSYVFDEVVTFFNKRGHHIKAVQIGNNLLHSSSIQFVHITETFFFEGWAYFEQHQDKRYSLTDCLSFLTMQRLGISLALTFDQHFVQAGFTKTPQ